MAEQEKMRNRSPTMRQLHRTTLTCTGNNSRDRPGNIGVVSASAGVRVQASGATTPGVSGAPDVIQSGAR
jgi:hypothetical protein